MYERVHTSGTRKKNKISTEIEIKREKYDFVCVCVFGPFGYGKFFSVFLALSHCWLMYIIFSFFLKMGIFLFSLCAQQKDAYSM
jgi:hypothetical protein